MWKIPASSFEHLFCVCSSLSRKNVNSCFFFWFQIVKHRPNVAVEIKGRRRLKIDKTNNDDSVNVNVFGLNRFINGLCEDYISDTT